MAKKRGKSKFFKVTFGAAVLNENTKNISITYKLVTTSREEQAEHMLWAMADFARKRLTGKLVLGDDMPNQKTMFEDRETISGTFDTKGTSVQLDKETLKTGIVFHDNEVDAAQVDRFKYHDGWIFIDEVADIPATVSNEPDTETVQMWTTVALAQLGLTGGLCNKIYDQGIRNLGRLVGVYTGNDAKYQKMTDVEGVTAREDKTIKSKITQYFETTQWENPLEAK